MAKKAAAQKKAKSRLPWILLPAGVIVVTFLVYLPSLRGDFLTYDDTDNVVNNALVHGLSPALVVQYFTRAILYMYTPLTFLSYAVDYALYGPDPFFFRLTNLLLHLLNIVLVYLFARKILRKELPALLVAVLFAFHPAGPDTVSWISARSNLLSTLFFLGSLLLYLKYLDGKKILLMALVTLSFLLSLLSKSAGIMLPVTLLLIDYYNRRTFSSRVILEKLPLFLLSLAFGLAAFWFRSDTGTPESVMHYTLPDRLLMGCYATGACLGRSIVPYNLSAIYAWPAKEGNMLPFLCYLAPFLLAGVVWLVSRLKVLKREVIFGMLFFLLNFLVTQVALLEDGFMANRYGYLPSVGLFFIPAVAAEYFASRNRRPAMVFVPVFTVLFLVFSFMTWQRSQAWKTTMGLFNDAAHHSPGSAFVFNNRGIARYSAGDMDGALADYDQAIRIYPGYSGAYYNRGIVRYGRQEFDGAEKDYSRAIELNPKFASSYMARGILEMDVKGDFERALSDYNQAISLNPAMAQAYYNRGILYLRMKEVTPACEDFHRVRSLGFDRADNLIRQFCE